MTCEIDSILETSSKTVQDSMEQIVQELAIDFDLELDVETLLKSPESTTLKGAMQTFVVWAVQQGR